MQALSDDQRIDILEKKVDEGFARMDRGLAEIRGDSRAMRENVRELREDIREIRGQVDTWGRSILAMWLTMVLGFGGLIVTLLAHA